MINTLFLDRDIRDLQALSGAMAGHDTVIHLASNPNIARAMREPTVDFDQGTILTQNVLEAMRLRLRAVLLQLRCIRRRERSAMRSGANH